MFPFKKSSFCEDSGISLVGKFKDVSEFQGLGEGRFFVGRFRYLPLFALLIYNKRLMSRCRCMTVYY